MTFRFARVVYGAAPGVPAMAQKAPAEATARERVTGSLTPSMVNIRATPLVVVGTGASSTIAIRTSLLQVVGTGQSVTVVIRTTPLQAIGSRTP